jgi:quinol-cytochrome oxidoreductase complex cytochrome b subunit
LVKGFQHYPFLRTIRTAMVLYILFGWVLFLLFFIPSLDASVSLSLSKRPTVKKVSESDVT